MGARLAVSFIADNTPLSQTKAAGAHAQETPTATIGKPRSKEAGAGVQDAGAAVASAGSRTQDAGAVDKMTLGVKSYRSVAMAPSCRLSPFATIVGDVTLGDEVSVFAGAHIRGDAAPIAIGARTNIQENCSLHVSGGTPLTIGEGVTVGHGAIVHGCTIADHVLVGMGSIVMDDAEIGEYSLVGAGALVTERKKFPPRSLIIGSPARAVRTLTDDEIDRLIVKAASAYVEVSGEMAAEGVLAHPTAGETIWMRTPADAAAARRG